MTYERFKELWLQAGLSVPTETDMSDHTIDALLRAAEGDFSDFNHLTNSTK